MEFTIAMSHKPSVIAFDVFGTLVEIGERRSPYKKLMKWLKENGRKPEPDDARFIMSTNSNLREFTALFGMNIPESLMQEIQADLDADLRSISLYPDTIFTLEKLKKLGFKVAICSNLAMPYGKPVSALLPTLDAYAWSYEVGAIKPEPPIYQYLVDQLECRTNEILFIGDTPSADFSGPSDFGMHARLIDRKNGQNFTDILSDILG